MVVERIVPLPLIALIVALGCGALNSEAPPETQADPLTATFSALAVVTAPLLAHDGQIPSIAEIEARYEKSFPCATVTRQGALVHLDFDDHCTSNDWTPRGRMSVALIREVGARRLSLGLEDLSVGSHELWGNLDLWPQRDQTTVSGELVVREQASTRSLFIRGHLVAEDSGVTLDATLDEGAGASAMALFVRTATMAPFGG